MTFDATALLHRSKVAYMKRYLTDLPLSRLRKMLRDTVRLVGQDAASAAAIRQAIAKKQAVQGKKEAKNAS
jgi:hypothetical protein